MGDGVALRVGLGLKLALGVGLEDWVALDVADGEAVGVRLGLGLGVTVGVALRVGLPVGVALKVGLPPTRTGASLEVPTEVLAWKSALLWMIPEVPDLTVPHQVNLVLDWHWTQGANHPSTPAVAVAGGRLPR